MHIELTEMLRCPDPHREDVLVLSTGEVKDRMVRSGLVGCPVCHREYPIIRGVVEFAGSREQGAGDDAASPPPSAPRSLLPAPSDLQAVLELSGPGGYVVLVGASARQAAGLAAVMEGIHFIGVNAPRDVEELPVLSLLRATDRIPLRSSIARGVVVGADLATSQWLVEAHRVLLRGRRVVVESDEPELPIGGGLVKLAAGNGLWVGAKS